MKYLQFFSPTDNQSIHAFTIYVIYSIERTNIHLVCPQVNRTSGIPNDVGYWCAFPSLFVSRCQRARHQQSEAPAWDSVAVGMLVEGWIWGRTLLFVEGCKPPK